ncbi:MAG: hypothetical protein ACRD3R_00680, partial [Terriglobales bacterium]
LPERQCKKHKGSYSIFSRFGSFTAAKIVIYEAGLGKRNGKWPPLPDGVYVLLRVPANDPNESIGIAPKREGRFSYFPVNEENLEEAVESIVKVA